MFDSVTSALIAASPRLTGVDNERLADQITDAYVQVTVAKSLLGTDLRAEDRLLDELRSIGASNEAIALAIDDPEVQQSAAYVAASAYHALSQALSNDQRNPRPLGSESISAAVAATLLFLVADAAPDASEAASFVEENNETPLSSLLELIRLLGRGEVHLNDSRQTIILNPDEDPSTLGATIGYWKCERTLLALIAKLDGQPSIEHDIESFADIASSMLSTLTFGSSDSTRTVTNRIVGPWHLARLLEMAEPTLLLSSTAAIDAPHNVDAAGWAQHLVRTARRRPLLWRNHRAALDSGLLDEGTSAVLAFPTGAGKSTLSELKVVATVLRGKNVICLAPTLSLVDQLARAFRQVAPTATVIAQREADEDLIGLGNVGPKIYVMTPESCLAALGLDFQRFGDVGLVMFDEAHLMHSEGSEPTRRSIDATLCFLTLATRFPAADLLLVSAMIANAEELSTWLASITERKAIALDDPWKPTRQARGALVYDAQRVRQLRAQLDEAFQSSTTQGVPAATRKTMTAFPYGLFSLRSTWESSNTRDYRFVRLLDEQVPLAIGGKRSKDNAWWLTPNANQVAASLARASARSGMKTLVFANQPTWTVSIARDISTGGTRHTRLVSAERDLMKRIVDALGTESAMYLAIDEGGVRGDAIPHHSLLLPDERRLHERLYQRPDGVPVLVATSTIAQGMNFPSEFVIITSDRRFDTATNSRARVESHELLNAAGRAGRAGAHANALVLVIPGDLVEYDGEGQIGAAWPPSKMLSPRVTSVLRLQTLFNLFSLH
ncbi:DEAD/DEAH box helicase [Pseudoclavibacter sp. 13-3]|uniref:DEAD/DEAH box helicase n=1 Tax=Pseudoclavibacter sp. 13-3 TaxID=2901228 RepID=UPI001E507C19|nr:DEAD/DEAH box helicase [Pseudoclavibacter sp. 13-3]MCD7100719.1 DEAD/DEAH box helicase [Pseudoclavibacter sp. 13-3]